MTAVLATVDQFRELYEVAAASRSNPVVQAWLDEAESALCIDVACTVEQIVGVPAALDLAGPEVLRRAANLMGRANSPEGRAGVEDGVLMIPFLEPGSPQTVMRIKRALGIPRAAAG